MPISKTAAADRVLARAYTSPTLVLLAMDWAAGKNFKDFLGFAIRRSPGFAKGEHDAYLVNKIGFQPPAKDSQPLPSNLAPFQKFLWWDAAISDADRGKTFVYTITPVRGTGPADLALQTQAESTISVMVPNVSRDGISTWFNRAVVSSQAFSREFPEPLKDIDACMQWLANGMQNAFPALLNKARTVDGAIYHLTDNEWVMPALKQFKGDLDIVYEDRKNDQTDLPAISLLRLPKGHAWPRSKTNIMHDKFLVDAPSGRVLTGSANFTPEGLTSQANLLHIFESHDLAGLYAARQELLREDPPVAETAKSGAWSKPVTIGKARLRVFFSPEPSKARKSIDTVVTAIKQAKSSVIFCMFDPTDPALLSALLAAGNGKKLLYGLLNNISNPGKKKTIQSASGEPPKKPTAATQIKVTLYNRSRKDKKVLAYSYFRPGNTPAGFLPELSAVDFSSKSTLPPPKKGKKTRYVPAVHIHHKFIVIDGETDHPTIYTGSNNLSNNSTHRNDENLLEITECPELAQTYFAEFMRLYEHYRARALWNMAHPVDKKSAGKPTPRQNSRLAQTFTLKTSRDAWVKGAYRAGTADALARTTLA